uniref:Inositol-tetrakisphosphate 1-kinase n=1 Tax=Canis lupus familiaris TaxID=9615 RepID=A0A8C0LUU3_CANLF
EAGAGRGRGRRRRAALPPGGRRRGPSSAPAGSSGPAGRVSAAAAGRGRGRPGLRLRAGTRARRRRRRVRTAARRRGRGRGRGCAGGRVRPAGVRARGEGAGVRAAGADRGRGGGAWRGAGPGLRRRRGGRGRGRGACGAARGLRAPGLRAPSGSFGLRRSGAQASPAGGGRRAAGGGGVGGGGGSQWPAALSAAPSAPPRPAPPRRPGPAPPRPAPPGRTARPEPRSASPPPEEVPARSRRTPGPPRSACGRFPPDPSSPPEEEDADVSEGEESWLLAEREENQEAEFPGLRRAVQEYIDAHPETIVLDPLPAIRTLLDRSKSYELIRKIEAYMKDDRICSPPFMELTSLSGDDTMRLLEQNGLAFPFICKTRVAHGTNSHEMAIVFNQEGLSAIQPPCVVQNFINHNAVLYKVFVVGESYTVVQRPSLKNFSAGTSDRESIFFNSHNVSKPESSSVLTALDKIEGVFERPSDEVIRELSRALRQALGVSLFGIDIIINNQTGQHAVIDINAFPGYEGVSEFFTDLLNHVATVLQGQSTATAAAGDVAPLRHSRLLAEQAGSLAGERTCSAGPGCCGSMMGPDPPWTSEADAGGMGAGGTAKLPHQRLGCTAAVSPSFQQHCVASLATKASSQ